jgi:hypothetical protein
MAIRAWLKIAAHCKVCGVFLPVGSEVMYEGHCQCVTCMSCIPVGTR